MNLSDNAGNFGTADKSFIVKESKIANTLRIKTYLIKILLSSVDQITVRCSADVLKELKNIKINYQNNMSLPPPPPPPPIPPNPAAMEANMDRASLSPYEEPQPEGLAVVMNIITTITHWLLGAISIGAFVYANQSGGSDHLKQHIYLNVTGYVILMTQAILSFNPNAGWTNNLMYPTKKVIHWMLQITGSSLAIAGSFIRISRVRWPFETAHGILGLIALCFTILSLVAGLMHLVCQSKLNTLLHRTIHSCLGILTITVAFITLCYGFSHDDFRDDLGDENADLCIAFTIIALIGTLISAFGTMFKRMCGSLNFDN